MYSQSNKSRVLQPLLQESPQSSTSLAPDVRRPSTTHTNDKNRMQLSTYLTPQSTPDGAFSRPPANNNDSSSNDGNNDINNQNQNTFASTFGRILTPRRLLRNYVPRSFGNKRPADFQSPQPCAAIPRRWTGRKASKNQPPHHSADGLDGAAAPSSFSSAPPPPPPPSQAEQQATMTTPPPSSVKRSSSCEALRGLSSSSGSSAMANLADSIMARAPQRRCRRRLYHRRYHRSSSSPSPNSPGPSRRRRRRRRRRGSLGTRDSRDSRGRRTANGGTGTAGRSLGGSAGGDFVPGVASSAGHSADPGSAGNPARAVAAVTAAALLTAEEMAQTQEVERLVPEAVHLVMVRLEAGIWRRLVTVGVGELLAVARLRGLFPPAPAATAAAVAQPGGAHGAQAGAGIVRQSAETEAETESEATTGGEEEWEEQQEGDRLASRQHDWLRRMNGTFATFELADRFRREFGGEAAVDLSRCCDRCRARARLLHPRCLARLRWRVEGSRGPVRARPAMYMLGGQEGVV